MIRILLALFALTSIAQAEGERPGDFDYYVLALSWSPNWCALEGDDKGSDQCDPRHDYGWVLHGLWPQNDQGYPSYCRTSARAPSRGMTGEMVDIMGSSGLAWHQWKKHGSCSGLRAGAYFDLSRQAYEKVNRPALLRKLTKPIQLPAKVVEEAFLEANPTLHANEITVTCKGGHIQEARICLTRDLEFRACGGQNALDCSFSKAVLNPVR